MSTASLSNVFSDVYITGNCTVKGTISSLAGSITSQWTTSGSIIYYNSGNVGIGTNNPTGSGSPGNLLHVYDTSANNPTVHVDSSGGTGQARLHLRAGAGTTNRASRIDFFNNVTSSTVPQWTIISGYDQNGTNDLRFVNYAGTIMMSWAQNGNIGIGTTNPGSLLTVTSGASIGSGYTAYSAPTGGLIVQGNVGIGTSNPGVNALQVSGNVVTSGFTSNSTNTIFNFDTLTVPFVNATQVSVTTNLGIGTTNPSGVLDVRGTSMYVGNQVNSAAASGATSNANIVLYGAGNNPITGSLPSIYHRGYVGLALCADYNISFEVNAAVSRIDAMRILSTGYVGIGTTNPQYLLHITGSASNAVSNIIVETGTNAIGQRSEIRFGIPAFSGTAYRAGVTSNTYASNGSDLQFWTNASSGSGSVPQMTILPSGYVGIGTTNPQYPLHLYLNNGTGTGFWFQNASGGYNYIGGTATGTAALNIRDTSGQWLQFYYGTTQTGSITTNGTNLQITGSPLSLNPTSGNVGIGITNPSYPLYINYTNSAGGINETGLYINNTAKANSAQITLAGNSVFSLISQGTAGGPPSGFSIYNNTTSTTPFCITSSGNIGIGTASPGSTLTVYSSNTSFDFTLASYATTLDFQSGVRLGLALPGWTTIDPNGGTTLATGVSIWDALVVGGYCIIGTSWGQSTTQTGPTNGLIVQGNVGIGTTSPGTNLDVNGTIRTSGNQGTNALILYFLSTCFTQQVSYTNFVDTSLTLSATYIPAAARAVLADVFIAPGLISGTTVDHEVFNLGSVSNGSQRTWVDGGWGSNPASYLGTLNNQIVRLLTDGENGSGTSYYMGLRGIWFPSLTIPIAANGVMYYSNYGNSTSSGYIFLNVKGYYM